MKKPIVHRHFPKSWSTFCGLDARNHEHVTSDDRKATCRRCLKAMGTYERSRLKWAEQGDTL
jgi:hypothetical protein